MYKYLSKWANKYQTTKTKMYQSDGVLNSFNNESDDQSINQSNNQKVYHSIPVIAKKT